MRVLCFLIVASIAVSQPTPPQTAPATRVIMLGTGSPVPDPNAQGPATAISVGPRLFVVDAGAGVTRQLAAAGIPRVTNVEATFLTHLHSDHTLGYPDLIFTTWIMGRREPLRVFGPPGLRRLTNRLMDAWREDIDVRVSGLERETRAWLAVDAHEIRPGLVYDTGGVRVTAIPVRHGNWKYAYAYRFDTPGKSVTISGDTAPSDTLVAAAKGSDVFIHEVYDAARVKKEDRPGGEFWPEYMRTFHTSNIELGRLATRVAPGVLVLTHMLRMGGTDEEMLAGIRQGGYTGRVVIAHDLDVF